jgi:hypothetical protein
VNFPLVAVQRFRGALLPLAVIAGLAMFTYFLVTPIRTWNTQRDLLSERSSRYAAFEEVNDVLQDEVDGLRDPVGVRQAIREQLGYLLPNERRVPMLASPEAPVTLPDRWPYTLVAGIVTLRDVRLAGALQGNPDTFDPTRP